MLDVPTPAEPASIKRQTNAIRRLEADVDIDRSEIPVTAGERERSAQSDVLGHCDDRSEGDGDRGTYRDRQPRRTRPNVERKRFERDRANGRVDRNCHGEATASSEVEATLRRQSDRQIEARGESISWQHASQKRIALTSRDHDATTP